MKSILLYPILLYLCKKIINNDDENYGLIILAFLMSIGYCNAQTQELYDPYTPEYFTGNDPAWLQEIQKNPRGVNFFEMERKFQEWLASDPDAKKKTPEKKPAVNFYRRWRRAYEPFVNNKGEIVLPKKSEYLKKIDASNATVQQNLTSGRRSKRALNTTAKKWQNIGLYKTAKNDQYTGFVASYDSHANVFRIDVFKKDPNILYCGAETGVVFKTTDKGLNWQACDPTFNFGKEIKAIYIDHSDSNTVWVGSDVGLFVTRNGGTSFTRIDGVTSTVNSIRVSPSDKNEVTVAAADGFYRSTDGKSFQKILNGKFYDHELKPNNPKTVYLLGEKKTSNRGELYISYDGGQNFRETVDVQGNGVRAGRLAVTHATGGEDYVYALVNINSFGYSYGMPRILKSIDAGLHWEDKTVATGQFYDRKNTFCPSIDAKQGGQGYYDMMIGVSDTNPEHIIFGLCSAYRSLKWAEKEAISKIR
ncbi:WD40/YVTN/BNR-like repeat-containing protein [Riemerella columbina]|uniref:WD40/YVTN/BNR-like repeat-containing protein n=1 Tax=Riemerella columbina TaxID=103810 RepID=UPI0003637AC1|nr:hypothetical protein [Riemerella columbina]